MDNLHVVVLYDGRLVWTVPTNLTSVISTFLENGTITDRIAGTLLDCGYRLELYVDFIFGNHCGNHYGNHCEIDELL